MKRGKRLTQSLAKLDKVEEIVKYATVHTACEMEYRRHFRDLRKALEDVSVENKEHRIRFAKKILGGRFFKKIKFMNRLKIGLKWIFTGEV